VGVGEGGSAGEGHEDIGKSEGRLQKPRLSLEEGGGGGGGGGGEGGGAGGGASEEEADDDFIQKMVFLWMRGVHTHARRLCAHRHMYTQTHMYV
jgi:hypothetical protein